MISMEIRPETFMTVERQTELFLLSVLLGVFLGVIYDLFRAVRAVFPPMGTRLPTMLCDMLYMLVFGVCIYLFALLEAGGELRGYYCAGAALGTAIYLLTAGTVVIGIIRGVFGAIRRLVLSAVSFFRKYITKKGYNFVTNDKKLFPNCKNTEKDLKNTP